MVEPAKGRISKHPDVRRIELLTSAMELFSQVGYTKTSIQMITDKVGVAKGLFYHYFDSKADLLNQLADWQTDQFMATLPQHASEMDGDALSKIRSLIGTIVQWKFEDLGALMLPYIETLYQEENLQFRTALVNEYLGRVTPLFAEIIAEGVDEGVCDVPDSETAAELIFAAWVGGADRMVQLMLDLPKGPEAVEPLLARVRAWEFAIERILGIERDTLQLYDYAFLQRAFEGLSTPLDGIAEGGE